MARVGVVGSFRDLAGLADHIDFIEESVQRFLVPEDDETVFEQASFGAAETSPPVDTANLFLPGEIKTTGPVVDMQRVVAYAECAFRRAKKVGIRTIVFGSGGSRALVENFDKGRAEQQFVDVLKAIAPIAANYTVQIVIEPLNRGECNFINSLAEGAEAVRSCGHPSILLLADIYHMLREDEEPQEILRFGDLLRHVHVAEKAERTAPGLAGDDFRPYLKALATSGYPGDFSLECRWNDLASEAASGAAELRRQIEEVW
jgi:sugar phosphate isomerase/epimerase